MALLHFSEKDERLTTFLDLNTMKQKTSETEVSSIAISGFERKGSLMIYLLVLMTVVYAVVHFALQDSHTYLPAADEFCPSEDPCARPDLFAFQVSSGIAIGYAGFVGFLVWHVTKRVHTILPSTPEGRLFGYLPESETLAVVNFSFQVWDFIVSLTIPEHSTFIFLTHHAMAATVSYMSIKHQYLHYYGVYFLGLTEFSSIFLVFVDLSRFFPPVPGTRFALLIDICGPAFVVTFFIYRVVLWWKVSYLLWRDAKHVLKTGIAEKLRPGKTYVLYVFLAANVPLGILQLYWFKIIMNEAAKVLAA